MAEIHLERIVRELYTQLRVRSIPALVGTERIEACIRREHSLTKRPEGPI